ncbi:MAG TPA: YceI family protein [Candidatus Angelobacter sp.]|nr:YceI family protein [Candidatus Angelobacter sp.]
MILRISWQRILISGLLLAPSAWPAQNAAVTSDDAGQQSAAEQKSSITVHVYKTGLFSAFAHNHIIVAPIAQSTTDAKRLAAEILVHSKEMRVTDPGDSDSTRSEIQATMLGPKVLDAEKFPEIHFKSSKIEPLRIEPLKAEPPDTQHYRVTGLLELHGTSKEISFEVTHSPGRYHGSTKLKQTEFGIQPVSIGGGAVKVKDQIDLDFDVFEN